MASRRNATLAMGLAAGVGTMTLFRANHTLPPTDGTAEERFRILQDQVFNGLGVSHVSSIHELTGPPVRVHVVEAGH
ncbi:MAG: hypothetical protein O3A63_20720 [Proteobacteria bacterium]|nr:hypothetical protein [Pseudomonadota bacterium]